MATIAIAATLVLMLLDKRGDFNMKLALAAVLVLLLVMSQMYKPC